MAVIAYVRGWPITFKGGKWLYVDTGEELPKTSIQQRRSCKRCGQSPTKEGHDACLGHIPGATSACCGHGVSESFVVKEKQ